LLLDECLDMLLATIDAAGMTESTLVVLVGCRGFALGEHGKVGSEVHDLYGELLHVPLLIREPRLEVAPPRSAEFVQPVDLHATLASWFGDQSSRGEAGRDLLARPTASPPDGRPYVTAFAQSGEATLRSKEWLFRVSAQSGGIGTLPRRMELYAKPDDRWEANEVADLCPEPAAEMLRAIEALPGSAS
jgi:arylsulfatase A-like enzyme